jgi:hypothetical protein
MASEAPEMRRARSEPARPYGGREYELMRAGPEGIYWRAAEGVEVRVAAAERQSDPPQQRRRSAVMPGVRMLFGAIFAR